MEYRERIREKEKTREKERYSCDLQSQDSDESGLSNSSFQFPNEKCSKLFISFSLSLSLSIPSYPFSLSMIAFLFLIHSFRHHLKSPLNEMGLCFKNARKSKSSFFFLSRYFSPFLSLSFSSLSLPQTFFLEKNFKMIHHQFSSPSSIQIPFVFSLSYSLSLSLSDFSLTK